MLSAVMDTQVPPSTRENMSKVKAPAAAKVRISVSILRRFNVLDTTCLLVAKNTLQ
jgi:hypothetical protein